MSHDYKVHCATCGKDVTDYFHGSLGLRYVFALIDNATTITAIAVLGRKLDGDELERVSIPRWSGPIELDEFANHDGHHLVAMIDYGKEITRERYAEGFFTV